jgi:hypothetical protein
VRRGDEAIAAEGFGRCVHFLSSVPPRQAGGRECRWRCGGGTNGLILRCAGWVGPAPAGGLSRTRSPAPVLVRAVAGTQRLRARAAPTATVVRASPLPVRALMSRSAPGLSHAAPA